MFLISVEAASVLEPSAEGSFHLVVDDEELPAGPIPWGCLGDLMLSQGNGTTGGGVWPTRRAEDPLAP
jgi:hypothetical protein